MNRVFGHNLKLCLVLLSDLLKTFCPLILWHCHSCNITIQWGDYWYETPVQIQTSMNSD